ncbi:MAG: GNAT family N-acetyltransferase [Candidatus Heimdallarchaeota archaeon]|nr:GNAT family N-acetyltransferase [Candidatus Heimdallarchaeota archaeon]MBY8993908.1 GNAT family N-acetyltransferase [Candidatus Heimdallarchaeota archaeon]
MSKTNNIQDSEIIILKRDESDEFIDLLLLCFGEGLERDRVNLVEIGKLMKKINKPFYRFLMKMMKVEMTNYGIKRDGKLVSALTLSTEKKTGTIGNVMTHPDYRRKGYAKKLFRKAVADGKKLGLNKITLDVHAQNTGAIKLYENEGFQRFYHTGKLKFDLSQNKISTNDSVILKEINNIDFEFYDSLLDVCYPQKMLEQRDRNKMAKDYIPNRFIRFLVTKVAGQKIYFYSLYKNGDKNTRGYVSAATSRIEEGLSISSPLVKNEDIDLVLPAISKLTTMITNDTNYLKLNLSMHRKALFDELIKSGFELTDESIYMNIKFGEEKTKLGETKNE